MTSPFLLDPVDLIAILVFACAWLSYAFVLERTAYGGNSLNRRMNDFRGVWIRRTLHREVRMVDMQIMTALQNGNAFFASTSLIAIGGALTLLRSTDDALHILKSLPIGLQPAPGFWQFKAIGLTVILTYAFFKFSWSYRLFNYVAILLGAMPFAADRETAEAQQHVARTTALFQSAGRHFNRGQRAFFFALGYLGWFLSPWVFMATTIGIMIVLWRRQFSSDAFDAMNIEGPSA
jgi:uncharacterized membrane protein